MITGLTFPPILFPFYLHNLYIHNSITIPNQLSFCPHSLSQSVPRCCLLNTSAILSFGLSDLLLRNSLPPHHHHDLHDIQGNLSIGFHQPPTGSTPTALLGILSYLLSGPTFHIDGVKSPKIFLCC